MVLPALACAQEIDTAAGVGRKPGTIFDEIQDAGERTAFRTLWNMPDPARRLALAQKFAEKYPSSAVLKETYEFAARASQALGDLPAALTWAKRSLRLMPENPFLLAMQADVAARLQQPELAQTSARDALGYLEEAVAPSPFTEQQWPQVRDQLRETCLFVLGRVAASQGRATEAERLLLAALRLNPDDLEALYVLGVARMADHRDEDAAPLLARVMSANGPLAADARRSLLGIFEKRQESQPFDKYAASLHWTPPQPEREAAPPAIEKYAGSETCRVCHAREYESWQSTGMAKMFRPYRSQDVIGDFSGHQMVAGQVRAITVGGRPVIEIRDNRNDSWTRYPVDFLIGSKWQQAYATRTAGGELRVLPLQYSRLESAWVNYWKIVDGEGSARTDPANFHQNPPGTLYTSDCAPCHTSQLRLDPRTGPSFREGGVDCEMCHGPSLAHAERMKKHAASAEEDLPVRFARIPAERSVAICAQCHMQSAVHEPSKTGAINYSDTAPFYRIYGTHLLSDFSRKAFYKDGRFKATTFIVEAFRRTQCFRKGGATCASCHDPHAPNAADNPKSLKFAADSDEMCLQCHSALRAKIGQHTRHAAGTEASRCVSCHMPRNMDAVLFKARSHQIDEIPDAEMTQRFGNHDSPNACLVCHQDRDVTWLRATMQAFQP